MKDNFLLKVKVKVSKKFVPVKLALLAKGFPGDAKRSFVILNS